MENDLKLYLAKILGELYSIKNDVAELNKDKDMAVADYIIWGLQNGVEPVINQEFRKEGFSLTEARYTEILNYIVDEINIETFKGSYDLEDAGFERVELLMAFRLMKAEGRFAAIIEKIENSHDSPSEHRKLDLK